MHIELKEYERIDDLHRKGYRIIQNTQKFCFGMDAVLLSGFARVKRDERVLDLGTGTAIIPLLLCARTEGACFEGLEIQADCADMAERSVALNGLSHIIKIRWGDIKEVDSLYKPAEFHVVTANPPYITKGGGRINPYESKAIARHEILCNLADIIKGASAMLMPNGRFYMVHRPQRLADIIVTLRNYGLEPKTLQFVQPYACKEPNMVLIEAVKNGNPMIKVMPVLVVYQNDGCYTEEVYRIYYG